MPLVLPTHRPHSKDLHDLTRARVHAWLRAQDRPVTSQDASQALGVGLTTCVCATSMPWPLRRSFVAPKSPPDVNGKPAPRWRYYGRPEVMGEVKEWKQRGADVQEEREREDLSGPQRIMWRVLEEALVDAARATEAQEWLREDARGSGLSLEEIAEDWGSLGEAARACGYPYRDVEEARP